jgi:hypothetical protein
VSRYAMPTSATAISRIAAPTLMSVEVDGAKLARIDVDILAGRSRWRDSLIVFKKRDSSSDDVS